MTTSIGIISDVHSSPEPLQQALDIFTTEGVDQIICAGDIAGYYETLSPTIELLKAHDCLAIIGNHDQKFLASERAAENPMARDYLQALPETLDLQIEGRRVYVVHANPPAHQHGGIKLLDPEGNTRPERLEQWAEALSTYDYDLLIVGHTHQVYTEQLGGMLLLNPGSSVFNHSCMIVSLPDMSVQTLALGDEEIVRCWNFGMLQH